MATPIRPPSNDRQVGGDHYRTEIQHWDFVIANDLDYFQGQITKYVTRWKKKNGIPDLEKALHFLEKYIETERGKLHETTQLIANTKIREALEKHPPHPIQKPMGNYQYQCMQCGEHYTCLGSDPWQAHGHCPGRSYVDPDNQSHP